MVKTDLVDDVASATRLREGRAGVEAVLRAVYRAGSISLADAARAARLPLPLATAVRRELEKAGVFERRQGLSLTRDGRAFVEEVLGFASLADVTCPTCHGHGAVLAGGAIDALAVLARHLDRAPATDVTLDQAPCTAETALRRAALIYRAGALEGRRILILGDDDSVSLALALFGQRVAGHMLATRIVVIELDPHRADFIEATAAAEGLAIEIVRRDLRDPLSADLLGVFDVVETDPPYTLEGATLFLTRAVEALAGGRGDVFFSFAHWPPARMLDLQRLFVDLGLAVRAVRPAFNDYGGAAVLGSTGQLIELVGTGARVREGRWEGPLYTADVNPRERRYRCTRCNREWLLGSRDLPATIEELKARGCPACGNHAFARARKAR